MASCSTATPSWSTRTSPRPIRRSSPASCAPPSRASSTPIKDPDSAIKSVMKRNETGDEKIELARLKMSLQRQLRHPVGQGERRRRHRRAAHAESDRADRRHLRLQEPKPKAADIFTSRVSAAGSRAEVLTRSPSPGGSRRGSVRRYRRRHADLSRRVGRRARAARIRRSKSAAASSPPWSARPAAASPP